MGNARALYEEAQRALAEESRMLLVGEDTAREIEALEAKLREADKHIAGLEVQHAEALKSARALMERAEKAERERDEARGRLEMASRTLHDAAVWRGIVAHASDWRACGESACKLDRAALGEKP